MSSKTKFHPSICPNYCKNNVSQKTALRSVMSMGTHSWCFCLLNTALFSDFTVILKML